MEKHAKDALVENWGLEDVHLQSCDLQAFLSCVWLDIAEARADGYEVGHDELVYRFIRFKLFLRTRAHRQRVVSPRTRWYDD